MRIEWSDFTFDYSNKYGDPFYHGAMLKERYTTMNAIFQYSRLYWLIQKSFRALKHQTSTTNLTSKSYGNVPNPEGVAVFARNIRSFVTLAQSNEIEVILASQASNIRGPWTPNIRPLQHIVALPPPEELIEHHLYYNRILEDMAADTGAWFVDNAEVLSNTSQYFVDEFHYTPLGISILVNSYMKFIIDHEIIP